MTLVLHGGTPVRQRPLPSRPSYGEGEIDAATTVLKRGALSGFLASPGKAFLGGEYVRAMEDAWTDHFRTRHAVSMNSATSCLFAAVKALGIGQGDEVIVTPWSMSASVACVVAAGGTPVFADIELETYGLDAASVSQVITPRTKAIVAVDLFGCPPRDITEIYSYGIPVIEDAAQAIGARVGTELAGTLGDIGVFSLNRHKTVHCGEGGITVTNEDTCAYYLRAYRNHGEMLATTLEGFQRLPSGFIGGNFRLGEIEAAIATVQLGRLEELTVPRIRNAGYLTTALSEMPGVVPPYVPRGYRHVYYLYAIQVDGSAERFAEALTAEGIPATRYVEPLYRLPVFRGYGRNGGPGDRETRFPCAERAFRHVVVIPHIHAGITEEDLADIVCGVEKVHDHLAQL